MRKVETLREGCANEYALGEVQSPEPHNSVRKREQIAEWTADGGAEKAAAAGKDRPKDRN